MRHDLEWLRQQTVSVRMFSQFCEKALGMRAKDPEHAAMARLLATLAGNFSEAYFGEPLALDVAERARTRLVELVETGVGGSAAGALQHISFLNEIARSELS